jgi:hypothetical protein
MTTPHAENDPKSQGAGAADSTDVAAPAARTGRGGWPWVFAALAALLALAVGGAVWWTLAASQRKAAHSAQVSTDAFASAMRKAGVTAPPAPDGRAPSQTLRVSGSHPFSATFTYPELTAVIRAFGPDANTAARMDVQVESLAAGSDGALRLTGRVSTGGSSYRGWVEGPVTLSAGHLSPAGAFTANVEGVGVSGAQAGQLANGVTQYFNRVLDSAKSLHVDAATIGPQGVTVTGSAPDSVSW